eukprot:m51a1_g4011 putative flap endonuclease-1 (388) ;mRNA; r:556941-558485
MGIHELSKVVGDESPAAIKENAIKNYFGRRVAIDASMSLYQFIIGIRQQDGAQTLTDELGETTSHILGMFYRTVRMISNGIKPVFVFDGKPPTLKSGELASRKQRAKEAQEKLEEAKEEGDKEEMGKLAKRTVRVSKEQNEDVKRLMRLLGVPIVEAPCEAEAQCAAMARAGLVWATATEDMDALTLGTPILLRHMNFAESRKMPIAEYHLDSILAGLAMSMDQFIDLCILLGCDYCDTIRGIGRKRAVELIKKHGSIEEVLKNIDHKKYQVPENWPYQDARELFRRPEVTDPATIELKWSDPDEAGLVEYLVKEKNFSEERVAAGIAKLKKARSTSVQGRLDSFFKPVAPSPAAAEAAAAASRKRKIEETKGKKEISFSKSKKKRT